MPPLYQILLKLVIDLLSICYSSFIVLLLWFIHSEIHKSKIFQTTFYTRLQKIYKRLHLYLSELCEPLLVEVLQFFNSSNIISDYILTDKPLTLLINFYFNLLKYTFSICMLLKSTIINELCTVFLVLKVIA